MTATPEPSASAAPAPAAGPPWQLRLLGGLALQRGEQQYHRLPSRAVTALLARLAMWPDRSHSREALVELLWPGVEQAVGRNRLRQALSTLRGLIEAPGKAPVLAADRLTVRILPGALVCDVVDFERALRAGQWAAASALYQGELLPGFYDGWIDDERTRLAARADVLPPVGTPAPGSAGPTAPWPEPGASPAPAVEWPPLPAYLTTYFGDDQALSRLGQSVLEHRLVTLLGPGGSGKTRLAVELAGRLQGQASSAAHEDRFDLVAFVPLAACNNTTAMLDALHATLRVRSSPGSGTERLVRALFGRRSLLLLDNLEQLLPQAAEVLAGLVGAVPQLHLLITSRCLLGLAGERELQLEPLRLPEPQATLAQAAASPGLALFIDRARAARADFDLNPRNAPVLVELVHLLQGMPLAIELAAARVRSIAPPAMLQMLQAARVQGSGGLELLARSGAGAGSGIDPRHASMYRVIEWSWQQLGAASSGFLASLTVFGGAFSGAAAVAVCGKSAVETYALLDDLQAHSMLRSRETADGSLRFVLSEPIREFAAAHLDTAEAALLRARQRAWCQHWAAGFGPTPPLAAVRAEMPHVVAAMQSAVADGVPHEALQIALALRLALNDVALPASGLASLEAALLACTDAPLASRGHTLLGVLSFEAGLRDQALAHVQRGLDLAPQGSPQRARALHALARVRWRSSRRADGLAPLLEEAVALALADRDIEAQASVHALCAFIANVHDADYARGEALHRQALALWEQLGNEPAINGGIYNLAVCAHNARRFGEALLRLDAVCASAREQEDWHQLSQALNVQGNTLSALREWPAALQAYAQSADVAWLIGDPHALGYALWNAPPVLAHLHRAEDAARLIGFVVQFWESRFGPLSPADLLELNRAERLVRVQLGAERAQALRASGARLEVAQARALLHAP